MANFPPISVMVGWSVVFWGESGMGGLAPCESSYEIFVFVIETLPFFHIRF